MYHGKSWQLGNIPLTEHERRRSMDLICQLIISQLKNSQLTALIFLLMCETPP